MYSLMPSTQSLRDDSTKSEIFKLAHSMTKWIVANRPDWQDPVNYIVEFIKYLRECYAAVRAAKKHSINAKIQWNAYVNRKTKPFRDDSAFRVMNR